MYYTRLPYHVTLSLAGSFRITCKDHITSLSPRSPFLLVTHHTTLTPQETHTKQRNVARAQTPAHRTPSGVNNPQFPILFFCTTSDAEPHKDAPRPALGIAYSQLCSAILTPGWCLLCDYAGGMGLRMLCDWLGAREELWDRDRGLDA
jgi:hypothetical protein